MALDWKDFWFEKCSVIVFYFKYILTVVRSDIGILWVMNGLGLRLNLILFVLVLSWHFCLASISHFKSRILFLFSKLWLQIAHHRGLCPSLLTELVRTFWEEKLKGRRRRNFLATSKETKPFFSTSYDLKAARSSFSLQHPLYGYIT